MVFSIVYGLTNTIISIADLSLFIGLTGIYSIIFGIAKFYGLSKLKNIQETEKKVEVSKIEKTAVTNISIYAAIMSFLHFSLAVVCLFFFEESPSNYHLWFIYFTSAASFIKIVIALANSIRTRKNHNIILHHLKLTDFANALISLALLQRCILYFAGYEHARIVGGVGGIFFSLCAMLVCLKMFFNFKKGKTKDGKITNSLD